MNMKKGDIYALPISGLRFIVVATLNQDGEYDGRVTVATMPDEWHREDIKLLNGKFRSPRTYRVWETGLEKVARYVGYTAQTSGPALGYGPKYDRPTKALLTQLGKSLRKRCSEEYRTELIRRAANNPWWCDTDVSRWPMHRLITEFDPD